MSYELDPIAGQWYRQIDKGQLFRVVSIDEDDDVIQIQYFDGDLEELDSEAWFALDLDLTETPEDWKGPVDDDADDLDGGETEASETDWRAPPKGKKKARETWEDEDDEDEKDDWDEDEDEELYDSES